MFKELQTYYDYIEESLSAHTVRSYKYAIDLFICYFNIQSLKDMTDITSANIHEWLSSLVRANENSENIVAKSTANARFRSIKAFYGWLKNVQYIDKSPCRGVKPLKEGRKLKKYLTLEEQKAMICACNSVKSQLMIAFAFFTGVRREELVNIELKDIYSENGDIYVLIHGKGNKERRLILPDELVYLLKTYLRKRTKGDNPYLFTTSKKGFNDKLEGNLHKISAESYRQTFKTAARLAGIDSSKIDDISTHSARRSFAAGLTRHYGASSFQIKEALGHASIITTEKYVSDLGSEIADGVMQQQTLNLWEMNNA